VYDSDVCCMTMYVRTTAVTRFGVVCESNRVTVSGGGRCVGVSVEKALLCVGPVGMRGWGGIPGRDLEN
jgi:hypothetical protein